jgi:UDP-3-O-[3-hydroxymyristoyl] glucosamine N-acyltransferase
MNKGINPADLAKEFRLQVLGSCDEPILNAGSVKKHDKNSIVWVKNAEALSKVKAGYVVIGYEHAAVVANPNITFLITDVKPRLVFAKIMAKYFDLDPAEAFDNYVHEHRRNPDIRIGENVFIGRDVKIGAGTLIHHNVVIQSRTRIGKNCVIKSHVSLGTEGLGLEMDTETDEYVKFPQLGGVVLEDNVEIGPTSTVRRSALDDTIIRRGTKIGSLVNIGHNCVIGENCILTCQIVTSGSSVIGNNVFMGVNSIVKNGVNIGNNVTLGQGAVITKSFGDNVVLVGNPAEPIEDYKHWTEIRKKLMQEGNA